MTIAHVRRWRRAILAALLFMWAAIAYASQEPHVGSDSVVQVFIAVVAAAVTSFATTYLGILTALARHEERQKADRARIERLESYSIEGMQQQLQTHDKEIGLLRTRAHGFANDIMKLLGKVGLTSHQDSRDQGG